MDSCRTRDGAVRILAALAAVAAALVLPAAAQAGAGTLVRAWFPQGDQLRFGVRAIDGRRPVLATTLQELLRGPAAAESRAGARTAFARGTRLLGLRREGSLLTVQLDRRFLQQTADSAAPVQPRRMRLRLLQLGRTLAQFPKLQRFRISVAGRLLEEYPELGMRWRPDEDGVWRLSELTRVPSFPLRTRFADADLEDAAQVRLAQSLLAGAGWLDPSDVSGELDDATRQALVAFEAWNGLERDGELTAASYARVLRAARPQPRDRSAGRHVEVYRDLGVLLLVEDGEVVRAVHTSTGMGGRTPAGTFRVYRKERLSWSVPFQVWMPWASYFVGGIAMHAYPSVPPYPASHGCVRLPAGEAPRVYGFAAAGTPVLVY